MLPIRDSNHATFYEPVGSTSLHCQLVASLKMTEISFENRLLNTTLTSEYIMIIHRQRYIVWSNNYHFFLQIQVQTLIQQIATG